MTSTNQPNSRSVPASSTPPDTNSAGNTAPGISVPVEGLGYPTPSPNLRLPNPAPGGVVAVIRREASFLVIQRGLEIPRAPGMFCFPGGSIEAGESPVEALHREMREELGISIQPLGKIWDCQTTRGVPLEWWATEIEGAASIRPCPVEVAWHGWLEIDQILALNTLLPTNQIFLKQWATGQIRWPTRREA